MLGSISPTGSPVRADPQLREVGAGKAVGNLPEHRKMVE